MALVALSCCVTRDRPWHPEHWQGSEGLSPPWDTPHLLIQGSPFLPQIFKGDI